MNNYQITITGYQAELIRDLMERLIFVEREQLPTMQPPAIPPGGMTEVTDLMVKVEACLDDVS